MHKNAPLGSSSLIQLKHLPSATHTNADRTSDKNFNAKLVLFGVNFCKWGISFVFHNNFEIELQLPQKFQADKN